jgi:pyrroloquinoline quinone biosynthesis protein D
MKVGARPRLAKKARVVFDRVDERWVMLAPERGLVLNDNARRVVGLLDGAHTIQSIVDEIASAAEKTERSTIERDVIVFLESLRERGLLDGGEE